MKKLLNNRHAREFVKYGLASVVALAADWGTLSALYRLADVNYLVAATAGFCLGLTITYLFSILWVFRHRAVESARTEFLIFLGIGGFGLVVNNFVLWVSHTYLHIAPDIAKPGASIIVFMINYTARKAFLFTHKRAPQ